MPIFGDPNATRLIVGLAPAAHGANRTGRMFHGDRSGDWLFRALHKASVAKLPYAHSIQDGQELYGALIAAVCHCAPPDNKPTPEEIGICTSRYLESLLFQQGGPPLQHSRLTDRKVRAARDCRWKSILCLGSIAWNNVHRLLGAKRTPFTHLVIDEIENGPKIVGSFHPSQQNTFTGKLTEPMLDAAVQAWLN